MTRLVGTGSLKAYLLLIGILDAFLTPCSVYINDWIPGLPGLEAGSGGRLVGEALEGLPDENMLVALP